MSICERINKTIKSIIDFYYGKAENEERKAFISAILRNSHKRQVTHTCRFFEYNKLEKHWRWESG